VRRAKLPPAAGGGNDGGSRVTTVEGARAMTRRTNGDASASEGAEARKTTRTRKRWT
jgi:hypothetical protein